MVYSHLKIWFWCSITDKYWINPTAIAFCIFISILYICMDFVWTAVTDPASKWFPSFHCSWNRYKIGSYRKSPHFHPHVLHDRSEKSHWELYVGEPSCCNSGEPVFGCSLCQTVVTPKDCTDIMSCEGMFYFEQGEKVLPWRLTAETGCRVLARRFQTNNRRQDTFFHIIKFVLTSSVMLFPKFNQHFRIYPNIF